MADRPIIFSGPMIAALLDGRKSMTRRALSRAWPVLGSSWAHKSAPWDGLLFGHPRTEARNGYDPHIAVPFLHPDDAARGATWDDDGIYRVRPPYAVGDRLWVREAWRPTFLPGGVEAIEWRADQAWLPYDRFVARLPDYLPDIWRRPSLNRWRPSIHMPRWASRLTLIVTAVKVERLQEISEEDARAEGVLWVPGHGEITPADLYEGYSNYLCCRQGFEVLWSSLHGPGAWEANPWVAAISFETHRCNIDQMAEAA